MVKKIQFRSVPLLPTLPTQPDPTPTSTTTISYTICTPTRPLLFNFFLFPRKNRASPSQNANQTKAADKRGNNTHPPTHRTAHHPRGQKHGATRASGAAGCFACLGGWVGRWDATRTATTLPAKNTTHRGSTITTKSPPTTTPPPNHYCLPHQPQALVGTERLVGTNSRSVRNTHHPSTPPPIPLLRATTTVSKKKKWTKKSVYIFSYFREKQNERRSKASVREKTDR